jgi:chemotaxis protein methyltransferase CheR
MSTHEQGLSNADFNRLRRLVYDRSGINLTAEKKTMLEVRIRRRLRSLNLESYAEYCEFLFAQRGHEGELVQLIDVVTTNKTDFFREPSHFVYLTEKALPALSERSRWGEPVLIWSAGCSTGEEPYTLAMVLSEYGLAHPGFRFRVLATDISTAVLAKAKLGVYSCEVVRAVPPDLQRKYFMRSRNPDSGVLRVVPELRQAVDFRRLNLVDEGFGLSGKADAIFFRNVMIYFDRATQKRILQKLTQYLVPGGYTFVGHSETLHDMGLPLEPVAPALYRKTDVAS